MNEVSDRCSICFEDGPALSRCDRCVASPDKCVCGQCYEHLATCPFCRKPLSPPHPEKEVDESTFVSLEKAAVVTLLIGSCLVVSFFVGALLACAVSHASVDRMHTRSDRPETRYAAKDVPVLVLYRVDYEREGWDAVIRELRREQRLGRAEHLTVSDGRTTSTARGLAHPTQNDNMTLWWNAQEPRIPASSVSTRGFHDGLYDDYSFIPFERPLATIKQIMTGLLFHTVLCAALWVAAKRRLLAL